MNNFSCRTCKVETFVFSQMKKEKSLVVRNRGVCKPCASEYEKSTSMIRKAERDPDNHLSCQDCDRIFSKYNKGNPSGKNQSTVLAPELYELTYRKMLNVDCPFCKSENIERY
jgi:hypothetical protein